jgi:hypothetical protein
MLLKWGSPEATYHELNSASKEQPFRGTKKPTLKPLSPFRQATYPPDLDRRRRPRPLGIVHFRRIRSTYKARFIALGFHFFLKPMNRLRFSADAFSA